MRKFLTIGDRVYELSPLNYSEFMILNYWHGGSDMAFNEWLRHNDLHEASSFNAEALAQAKLHVEFSAKVFNFKNKDDTWTDNALGQAMQSHPDRFGPKGCSALADSD